MADHDPPFANFVLSEHVPEIERNLSKRPVSAGGFCDLYKSRVEGYGAIAVKMMRCLGTQETSKSSIIAP